MSEEQLMNSCKVADGMVRHLLTSPDTPDLPLEQYHVHRQDHDADDHSTIVRRDVDQVDRLHAPDHRRRIRQAVCIVPAGIDPIGPTRYIPTNSPGIFSDISVTRRGTMDLEVRSRTLGHEAARLEFYRNIFLLVSAFLSSKLLSAISTTSLDRVTEQQRGITEIMEKVWNAIDPIMSLRFIPHVVPVFMEAHLVPDLPVREIANRLYFSALSAEFMSAGDFSVMEAKTFDALRKISEEQNPLFNEDSIAFFTDR